MLLAVVQLGRIELAGRIRTGDVAVDLLHPIHPLARSPDRGVLVYCA